VSSATISTEVVERQGSGCARRTLVLADHNAGEGYAAQVAVASEIPLTPDETIWVIHLAVAVEMRLSPDSVAPLRCFNVWNEESARAALGVIAFLYAHTQAPVTA